MTSESVSLSGRLLAGIVVALALTLPAVASAANTITVNTQTDELGQAGKCSLREAVLEVTAPGTHSAFCPGAVTGQPTTIVLPAGTYDVPGGLELFDLPAAVTIKGAGAASTTVDAQQSAPVFDIASSEVTLSGITVTGGKAADGQPGTNGAGPGGSGGFGGPGDSGGGISNNGQLTLIDDVVRGNTAGNGGAGGVGNAGKAGGDGGSGGNGGGIASGGGHDLTLIRTIVTQNFAGQGGNGGAGGNGASGQAGGLGGKGGTGGSGGGVSNRTGTVTVTSSTIEGNGAGAGGPGGLGGKGGDGIDASPGSDSNGGPGGDGGRGGGGGEAGVGGGIFSDDTLTITGSTIDGNASGAGGPGAAGNDGGVGGMGDGSGSDGLNGDGGAGGFGASGNGAGDNGGGGGIYSAGTTSVTNTTVSGNTAGGGGAGASGGAGGAGAANGAGGNGGDGGAAGGVVLHTGGNPTFVNVTVAGNHATDGGAGGPALPGATAGTSGATGAIGGIEANALTLSNSIVASNEPGNCMGTITGNGHDLTFGDTSCPADLSADPKLGPLALNGGPTKTMALGAGSPAIDAVPASGAGCPAADQRGVPRPQPAGGKCDIGAYEAAPAPACQAVAAATGEGQPVTVSFSCSNPAGSQSPLAFAIGTGPAHGSLGPIDQAGGRVTYTPATGFHGADSFTYHATGLTGSSSSATVTLTVSAPPNPPVTNPSVTLGSRTVTIGKNGTGVLSLTCTAPAGQECVVSGAVYGPGKLPAGVARATKHRPKHASKLGTISGRIPAGQAGTAKVKLNRAGRKALKRSRKLHVRALITTTDAAGGTSSLATKLTLQQKKHKRK